VETGTGRRQEGKKEERTEVEKENYHRKQGRYVEEKIKMNLRRKWVYTYRHNVGSWSDGRMDREEGTYVQRERERTGERQMLLDIIAERIVLRAFITVSIGHVRWETAAVCLFISVEEKGCPYLPPDGVNMKLINYCAVSF